MVGNVRTWRQLTVWLHVLTSVGWMALALTLLALLALAATAAEPGVAASATSMAHYLDTVLLAPLANASASTGLMLSLGTAWGLVHHRWVFAKFAITFVQFYCAIFLLSKALSTAADSASAEAALIGGTVAMVGALAFQAWLSVAKPGPKTRFARDRRTGRPVRLPTAPAPMFAAAVLAPLVDIAVGLAVGIPLPALSLVTLVVAIVARRRALRAADKGPTAPRPVPAA